MATIKQRKAFDRIVENRGNISKSMREVGYEENTAKNPKNLTDSKGFKELANELGLTDDFITKALIEDITNKPGERSRELALAIKVKGLEKTSIDITTKSMDEPDTDLADDYAAYLKNKKN